MYYQNIDFVKQFLKIYFTHPIKIQDDNHDFMIQNSELQLPTKVEVQSLTFVLID